MSDYGDFRTPDPGPGCVFLHHVEDAICDMGDVLDERTISVVLGRIADYFNEDGFPVGADQEDTDA